MRILVTDGMDKTAMAQLREAGHEVVEQFYEPDQLGAALREFDAVVVRSKTKVRANHIDEAKGGKLKLIIRGGVGVDNIDVKYAEANGITVKNTPKASSLANPIISGLENVSNGVKVKWGAVSGAEKYRVFYKTAGTGWKVVGDTTATSYTVTGLRSGTRYTFTIRCISADAKRYTSDYDRTGKSITYIAQPTVRALESVSGGVMVKWNAVSGAEKYRVYYKTASTSWKSGGDTTGTSQTVTGLQSGTEYTFTVRCVTADGKGFTSSYDSKGVTLTVK